MPDTETSEDLGASHPQTETPDDTTPPSSSGDPDGSRVADTPSEEPASLEDAIAEAFDADPNAAPKKPVVSDDEDDEADDPDATSEAGGDGDPEAASEDDDDADTDGDGKAKAETDKSDDDKEDADPDEDELKAYRPAARKRVKQLLSQRNAARREAESLKPAAQQYQALRTYMAQNDLADQEVADLFKLGADLKSGDPARLKTFLERVTPFVQMAQEALGQTVPQDLQEQVDAGEMTEAAARELAKHRRNAELAQTRATRQSEQQRQQEVARQTQAHQAKMAEGLRTWTEQKAASDPDFARKQDAMKVIAQGLVAERGLPKTPEDAIRYAEEAYRLVGGVSKPARKATRPSPSTSASPSRAGVSPAPTTLEDVIEAGLRHTG